jgi:malonate-semialdehyde dehydrogenase (acetylating)/methylmalonate-semialdehyde dehydrogenase
MHEEKVMIYRINHFINGEIYENPHNELQDIFNPATREIIGRVSIAEKDDVDKAVVAARNSFASWSMTSANKRAQLLFRFRELLLQTKDELAKIISLEHGKTIADAQGSIQRGIDVVEFACGISSHIQTYYTKDIAQGIDSYSLRQPLGVCIGITPFNFPAMIPLWMFPLAIACGNTFILKPSEKDPSAALHLAELLKKAGVPDGVFNVVQGTQIAVNTLITHAEVKAVSFVGSTAIAEHVYQTATSLGKRVQAFGGAKNHAVVMPDADLDLVADAIVGAAYGSAGERCMAISVVVCVGDKVADQLIKKLMLKIKQLQVGPGDDATTDIGPLISATHLEKVSGYIEHGVAEGASLIIDGRKTMQENAQGFYLGASLFDHVKPTMKIYKEEIFGPVLSLLRVKNLDEALRLISAHEYGNGAAIFTRDGHTAREFAAQVQIGMVGINVPIPVPVAYFSFGGWKRSFFGDLPMHGKEGVMFYTKLKTVTQRWPQENGGAEFTMPVIK